MNVQQIIFRLLIGAAISFAMLAFLLFAFSSTGQTLNLSKLVDLIRNITPIALFSYVATQLIGVILRSYRYKILLLNAGDQSKPGFSDLFPVTLVRNMTVDLLPARVGELVFVGLLKRTNNTHASHSLTSLLFATLFDIAIILPVVFVLALFILTERQTQVTMFFGACLILACLLIIFAGLKYVTPWIAQRISHFSSMHQTGLVRKFSSFIEELNAAIQSTISAGHFNYVVSLTIALRITKYAGLCMLFIGVVQINFPHLAQIPLSQLISILIAGETTASLPVPTFLSLGSYEAGSAGMLSVFGVELSTAVIIMLAVHLSSQIIDYTMGLAAVAWLLFRSSLPTRHRQHSRPSMLMFSVITVLVTIALIVLFSGWQAIRTAWSLNSPPAGQIVDTGHLPTVPDSWSNQNGFIVWSSNRSGNHDIYYMDLPSQKVTQLTNHAFTENLPKISPDGKKIVFQRGRKNWHSFRDPTPWDLILKDLKTGEETLLAENATDPNWSKNGKQATFRRNFSEMYAIDINTGEETLLYTSSALNLPENAGLQTPMINSAGELAVTVRGPLRMTAVYKINNPIHIGQGCQVTWSPDERFVYYIDHGGNGQNLLRRYDFETAENKIWMDMPGEYSHEYFPKLTQDGRWMVFAASTGGHEHDTADYELFLWEVDSPPSTAIRLTHHSGNDSWPDIYLKGI